ncbi:hypothetical protein DVH24_006193 [Malus domestica]|uniref:Uncharacterized protein n=1 Tax=Malus domestica TaxID=3750 RepID=A0A498KPR3_MALDO|nr:hypothetical protein DVH24_006193 [Malus domestica]
MSSFIQKCGKFFERVEYWDSDQRQLFLTIVNVLKEHKNLGKGVFQILTKYLATFSGEDVHTLSKPKRSCTHNCGICEGLRHVSVRLAKYACVEQTGEGC